MAKISGPLLDRIDIHIEVPAVPFQELASDRAGTSSAEMRENVMRARSIQQDRYEGQISGATNAKLQSQQVRRFCRLNRECMELLRHSVQESGLSARAHDKVLRVARTIADLEGHQDIEPSDISEATNYRMLDRQMWS